MNQYQASISECTKIPQMRPDHGLITSVTSIMGKLVEKQLLSRARNNINPAQSRLQFSFTRGCSPTYAVIMFTEIVAEAKDNKQELYNPT